MHSLAQWITEKFNAHGLLAGRANRRKVIAQEPSPHRFVRERETHRTLQMSAEDQNWEADIANGIRLPRSAGKRRPGTRRAGRL